MKLKEIPKNERPRERLIKYGAENLANEDLISIILGTGTKDINVRELSIKILNQIKSLNDLSNLTVKELDVPSFIVIEVLDNTISPYTLGV